MNLKKLGQIILLVLGILLGAGLVVFVISNKQPLSLRFLDFETTTQWSSLVVLTSFFLGMLVMLLVAIWSGVIRFRHNTQLKRENTKLKAKIAEYEKRFPPLPYNELQEAATDEKPPKQEQEQPEHP